MIIMRVSSPIYGIASRAYRNVFDSWLTPHLPGGAPQIAFATIGIARGSRRDLQVYGHRGSGGWTVPAEAIAPGAICYCAGVGEDVSFDLALIEKHACEVFSFDPTPRSIEFVGNEVDADPRFHFLPYGIWSEDRTMTFHQPEEGLMFHSLTSDADASSQFDAECKRLATLMRELGHDHIDLLKLDIEGAEYDVVDDLVTSGIRPRVLCVEFHGVARMDASMWRLRRSLRALAQTGYRIVHIEHLNFTFLRADGDRSYELNGRSGGSCTTHRCTAPNAGNVASIRNYRTGRTRFILSVSWPRPSTMWLWGRADHGKGDAPGPGT